MGGQNHAPTNSKITPASAWLSRQVGEGIITIQQANNHLEDAIMLGMGRLHITDLVPSLSGVPSHHLALSADALRASLGALDSIDRGFARLGEIAKEIGYEGNPLATSVRRLNLDKAFDGHLILPYINTAVWDELLSHIERDNILATLDWERSQFRVLSRADSRSHPDTEECQRIASTYGDSAFADAVECNKVPFRQIYARVFSLWNHHNAMFLYSALIMTELFYRLNGYASLTDFDSSAVNTEVA